MKSDKRKVDKRLMTKRQQQIAVNRVRTSNSLESEAWAIQLKYGRTYHVLPGENLHLVGIYYPNNAVRPFPYGTEGQTTALFTSRQKAREAITTLPPILLPCAPVRVTVTIKKGRPAWAKGART